MRAGARRLMLIAVIVAGCAAPRTAPPPTVVLRPEDGPVWIDPDDIGRFRCARGLLVCSDAMVRVSQRRCQCM